MKALSGVEGAVKPRTTSLLKNQLSSLKSMVVESLHSLSVNDDGSISGKKRSGGSSKHHSDQQLSLLSGSADQDFADEDSV